MHPILTFVAAAAPLLASAAPTALTTYKDPHLRVSLISAQSVLAPGRTTRLGLYIEHAPHWHTYWINPCDSGLATKLHWTLPSGYRAGDIQWPTPQRLNQGDIYDFGYNGDTLLPVVLQVPADAKPGSTAHLRVEAKWLVCRERCIPGKARLGLDLPVGKTPASDPRTTALFARSRSDQPKPVDWKGSATVQGNRIQVLLEDPKLAAHATLDAFAQTGQVVASAPPRITRQANRIKLDFAKNEYYVAPPPHLVLVLTATHGEQRHAYRIEVPFATVGKPEPSS